VLLDPASELASLGTRFVVLDLTHLSQGDRDRLRRQLAVPGIDRFLVNETREIYVTLIAS
jgi:predicted kinase